MKEAQYRGSDGYVARSIPTGSLCTTMNDSIIRKDQKDRSNQQTRATELQGEKWKVINQGKMWRFLVQTANDLQGL